MHPTADQPQNATSPAGTSVTQLELTEGGGNHTSVQQRMRAVMAQVHALPRYQPRHHVVMWWLMSYANRDGIARISLKRLARDLGRDHSRVCREVRELAEHGFVEGRPSTVQPNRREYFMPGMVAPIRAV